MKRADEKLMCVITKAISLLLLSTNKVFWGGIFGIKAWVIRNENGLGFKELGMVMCISGRYFFFLLHF